MKSLELVVVLLAVAGALRILAVRISVPYPVLFVLGGLGLAMLKGLPRPSVDPDTLFLVFVPPLLYWTSLNTSLRDFREQFGAIARYGTLVVVLTMAAVAVVAHALAPELTWASAFLLGAIVSPPDPVAATAVLRTVGAPAAIMTILEGEGLVNDATALVLYRVAVAAVVTGSFSLGGTALRLLLTGVGGAAIGLAIGWLIGLIRRHLAPLPIVENTLSLLTPFIAYIPADALGLSGVLAVVSVGLYLGRLGPSVISPATRVQGEGIWTLVEFLLESTIFILVGLDLPYLHGALTQHSLGFLLGLSVAVAGACIIVRMIYTFTAVAVLRALHRRADRPTEPAWRHAAFIGWTGMRGGDSLVIALALPAVTATRAPFPGRDLIIFTTFAVIFATLVLQGLSIVPVLRLLHIHADGTADAEEAHARRVLAERGLRYVDRIVARGDVDAETAAQLRTRYQRRLHQWTARDDGRAAEPAAEASAMAYRALRSAMLDEERHTVIALRDDGTIGDDVLRRIQRDLDLEQMLIDAGDDDAPETPFEPGLDGAS